MPKIQVNSKFFSDKVLSSLVSWYHIPELSIQFWFYKFKPRLKYCWVWVGRSWGDLRLVQISMEDRWIDGLWVDQTWHNQFIWHYVFWTCVQHLGPHYYFVVQREFLTSLRCLQSMWTLCQRGLVLRSRVWLSKNRNILIQALLAQNGWVVIHIVWVLNSRFDLSFLWIEPKKLNPCRMYPLSLKPIEETVFNDNSLFRGKLP